MQGQLADGITIAGASLSLLSKHELEAGMAWDNEMEIHQHIAAGQLAYEQAGGRAGRRCACVCVCVWGGGAVYMFYISSYCYR